MHSPHSDLPRLNSRISFISLAMTRANRHLPNHAAEDPVVCYPSWDTSAIVRFSPICTLASLINGPAYFAMGSQFHHSPHKRDMLCDSGSHVTDDRRLGGLWDLEVRRR